MFPLCGENGWDCGRSIVIGFSGFLTTIVGCYAFYRVLRLWLHTKFHSIELIMILLSCLQTMLSTLYFLVVEEERLEYGIKYLRAVQSTLTALNYGIVALDIFGRRDLVKKLLFPGMLAILLGFTVLFIVACAEFDLDCAHPSWLAMSVVSLVVALSFTIAGFFVLRRLAKRQNPSYAQQNQQSQPYAPPPSVEIEEDHDEVTGHNEAASEGPLSKEGPLHSSQGLKTTWGFRQEPQQHEEGALVRQKRYQLFVLIVVNAIAAVFQLVLDIVINSLYERQQSCRLLETDSAFAQLMVLVLRLLAYLFPVWGTLYVFFWIPRKAYNTKHDVILHDSELNLLESDPEGLQVKASS